MSARAEPFFSTFRTFGRELRPGDGVPSSRILSRGRFFFSYVKRVWTTRTVTPTVSPRSTGPGSIIAANVQRQWCTNWREKPLSLPPHRKLLERIFAGRVFSLFVDDDEKRTYF